MNEMETIKTSDFLLASTLLAKGFPILGIDKMNPKRINFIFEKTSYIESFLADYWERKVLVIPQDLNSAERDIKAKINTQYE